MKIIEPKDAAAVVLLKSRDEIEIFWAKRSINLSFLGGWHAFPGGKIDKNDYQIPVKNAVETEDSALIVGAVREVFEEIGILLVRGGEKLTKGQRASLHDDLVSNRSTFSEILEHWGLWIDAQDFSYLGTWITPKFSPVRFKTRFFLAICPPKQVPYAACGELENGEFISPQNALSKWANGEVLIAPPILNTFRVFAENGQKKEDFEPSLFYQKCVSDLISKAQIDGENPRFIELNQFVTVFPLKTPTIPPATHTNCFIVGKKEFIVIDAASADLEEQAVFHKFISEKIENGDICREIIVSHLHQDHFGGETNLQKLLKEKFNLSVPLSAHKLTAESLTGKVEFQKHTSEDEFWDLKDEEGRFFRVQAIYAPGHARGHLNFYLENIGFLISCDNVVGSGTVVIAPPEGNMKDYLETLENLLNLPFLRHLCGSHGAASADAQGKINEYLRHRKEREKQVLEAIENGNQTVEKITQTVYQDLQPHLFPFAVKSISAHLEKLVEENILKIENDIVKLL